MLRVGEAHKGEEGLEGGQAFGQFPLAEGRDGPHGLVTVSAGALGGVLVRIAIVEEGNLDGALGFGPDLLAGVEGVEVVRNDQGRTGAAAHLADSARALPVEEPAGGGNLGAFGLEIVGVGAVLQPERLAPDAVVVVHRAVRGKFPAVEGTRQVDVVRLGHHEGEMDLARRGGGGQGSAQEKGRAPAEMTVELERSAHRWDQDAGSRRPRQARREIPPPIPLPSAGRSSRIARQGWTQTPRAGMAS